MLDQKLNFNESLSPTNILNFGAVDEKDNSLLYYFDLDLEFKEYESLLLSVDKYFVSDEQEVKFIRISMLKKDTQKAFKRFYGPAIRSGMSERYVLEANYSKVIESMSSSEVKEKYIFRIEVSVTDVSQIGEAAIETLVSDFKFYLKKGKHGY